MTRSPVVPARRLAVRTFLVALCVAGLNAPHAHAQQASLPKVSPELEKLRSALDKYQDPIVAVHDGYFSTVGCINFPRPGGPGDVPSYKSAGAMGVHFINVGLIGPTVDPLRPQILLYEPEGERLKLVAAEWFVPLSTGVAARPELYGQLFDGPMEGHHPFMPVQLSHYDLHVWLWKENPAGLFSPTNPAVRCPAGAPYSVDESGSKLVAHDGQPSQSDASTTGQD
jgi:hypothetical protein